MVYCSGLSGLLTSVGFETYQTTDMSLPHNEDKHASIPVTHSMKEEYRGISVVSQKIKYVEHSLVICVDLQIEDGKFFVRKK